MSLLGTPFVHFRGSIGGFGERDVEKVKFTPLTLMRTEQPKYQESSRWEGGFLFTK